MAVDVVAVVTDPVDADGVVAAAAVVAHFAAVVVELTNACSACVVAYGIAVAADCVLVAVGLQLRQLASMRNDVEVLDGGEAVIGN